MRREEAAAAELDLILAQLKRLQAAAEAEKKELQAQVNLGKKPQLLVVRELSQS